jgi:hypothetical protein
MTRKIDPHQQLIEHIKGVRRIVINDCFGGFGLSEEAVAAYLQLLGKPVWPEDNKQYKGMGLVTYWLIPPEADRVDSSPSNWDEMTTAERTAHNQAYQQQVFDPNNIDRDDAYLVQVIKELGDLASGKHAKLKVVEIPAYVDWQIEEYDGNEWVAEVHRTWR